MQGLTSALGKRLTGALFSGVVLLIASCGGDEPSPPVQATAGPTTPTPLVRAPVHSSPIAITADGAWVVVANSDSNTISLVSMDGEEIEAEIGVGREPRSVGVHPWLERAYVTNLADDTISVVDLAERREVATAAVGDEPYGMVVSPDGATLYVSLSGEESIAVVDAETLAVAVHIPVETRPRGLALTADGTTLYVTHLLTGRVSVVDVPSESVTAVVGTGLESNAAQAIAIHPSETRAYVPHIRSRVSNADLLLDSTIAPVVSVLDLATNTTIRKEVLGLDAIDRPVNNPTAVDFSPDGRYLYVVNAGSNDVSVIDLTTGLAAGHIQVGDNPRGIAVAPDGERAYVANLLSDDISVLNLKFNREARRVKVTISLLPPMVQAGKRHFFSSARPELARDRWISCASCHIEGEQDGRAWLFPDGPRNTPVMRGLRQTPPYHWSGDRVDLFDFQATIRGRQGGTGLSEEENEELAAFLGYMGFPPNPKLESDGSLSAAAQRGKGLFESAEAGCAQCHGGPAYTNGAAYDVGTGDGPGERAGPLFDTPSLRGLYSTAPYLHNGSAPTLLDVLTSGNRGDRHGATSRLTEEELSELVAFLNSLPYE